MKKSTIITQVIAISVTLLFDMSMANAQTLPDLSESNDPNLLVNPDEFHEFFGNPEEFDEEKNGNQMFINLLQGANECAANLIEQYGMADEVKEFFEYVFSDQWIEMVEYGTKE